MKNKVYRWLTRRLSGLRAIPHSLEVSVDRYTEARFAGFLYELANAIERNGRESRQLQADTRSLAGWFWLDSATGDGGMVRADLGDELMVLDTYDGGTRPLITSMMPHANQCRLISRHGTVGWHWYPDSASLKNAMKCWLDAKSKSA